MSTFAVVVEPLSGSERAELAAIEIAIEDGQRVFAAIGARLVRVREGRLYREDHATFDDYCRKRWGFRREVADRFIRAAAVQNALNPIGLTRPLTESVAREYAPLLTDPDALLRAGRETINRFGPTPTAAQTRQVVRGDASPPPAAPPRKDMRFELLEDVVGEAQGMPDPAVVIWPSTERGDIEMVEQSVAWIKAWVAAIDRSWAAHKRLLPTELRPRSARPKHKPKLKAA